MRTAHVAIHDGLSDWEAGHLLAELRTGRFTATRFEVVTVAETMRREAPALFQDFERDGDGSWAPRFRKV